MFSLRDICTKKKFFLKLLISNFMVFNITYAMDPNAVKDKPPTKFVTRSFIPPRKEREHHPVFPPPFIRASEKT